MRRRTTIISASIVALFICGVGSYFLFFRGPASSGSTSTQQAAAPISDESAATQDLQQLGSAEQRADSDDTDVVTGSTQDSNAVGDSVDENAL